MGEQADPAPAGLDVNRPAGRRHEARENAEQCRLPGSVCSTDNEKSTSRQIERDTAEDTAPAVAFLQAAGPDHQSTSSATKPRKTRLMIPFTVKNAASSRRRSPGRTRECS